MATFEPVWVSSLEHIETFEKAYLGTPFHWRILGAYSLPEGFPYVRGVFGFPWCIPLIMFASGRIQIQDQSITFESRQLKLPLNLVRNLSTGLNFVLEGGDILAIERHLGQSPVARVFDLPFIRVRTKKDAKLADFLLGTKLRKRTEALLFGDN